MAEAARRGVVRGSVRTKLRFVTQEQVTVNLVDEHVVAQLGVDGVRARDGVQQELQRLGVRVVLRVNDEHDGAAVLQDGLCAVRLPAVQDALVEVVEPRHVPDLELHERVVGNELDVQPVGALQEQGFVGRHLLEHHALDARLPGPDAARTHMPRRLQVSAAPAPTTAPCKQQGWASA